MTVGSEGGGDQSVAREAARADSRAKGPHVGGGNVLGNVEEEEEDCGEGGGVGVHFGEERGL